MKNMPKRRMFQIILAQPDPYNYDMKVGLAVNVVSPAEGSIAYRVIQLKPKIRTVKVTFHKECGWLTHKEEQTHRKHGWYLPECTKSPTGKHEWICPATGVHQEEIIPWCLYCKKDKES